MKSVSIELKKKGSTSDVERFYYYIMECHGTCSSKRMNVAINMDVNVKENGMIISLHKHVKSYNQWMC